MNNNELDARDYLFQFDNILNGMSNGMLSNRITNNITVDFINCMIPHHQAAIYMCQNLLKYTDNERLKNIALSIIRMQTEGIRNMQNILRNNSQNSLYSDSLISSNFYISTFFNITTLMITKMISSIRSLNIDFDFVSEMIPHHEGALAMCHNLLSYTIDPKLHKVALSIIEEQSKGINQLKEIQKELINK